MELWQERVDSPLGTIVLVTSGERLCSLDFCGYEDRMHRLLFKRFGAVKLSARPEASGAQLALRAYLGGELHAFAKIPLCLDGTAFQENVWAALKRIQPGSTCSYKFIAQDLGKPGASRAVGMANRSNPIALAIPCHRVIGANGTLGGYAGGIEKKKWLLDHERKWA